MPNWNIPLPEIDQSIVRPFIMGVISKLQKKIKLPSDTKIFFPGDSTKMQTHGSNVEQSTATRDPIFEANRISFVEVENLNPLESYAGPHTRGRAQLPVFLDQALNFIVRPIYFTNMFNFTITHRFDSESAAKRWRNDLIVNITELRDIHTYNVEYHYPVSDVIFQLIKEIHSKREAVAGYGETLQTYLARISSNSVTVVSDSTGTNGSLAVKESQFRIVGSYMFNGVPEAPARNESVGCWEMTLQYRIQFDCPIEFNVQYPVMVHNQLLEADWLLPAKSNADMPNEEGVNLSASVSNASFYFMEDTSMEDRMLDIDPLIYIPTVDDFVPKDYPGVGYFMSVLAEVDTVDKKSLFNLKELGDVKMDDDILEFIQMSEYPYIGKRNKSIVQAFLFRNSNLVESGSVICDSSLNIKLNSPADLRRQTRIIFGLYTDLTQLDNEALARLLKFPKAFVKILASINELMRNHHDLYKYYDKRVITALDFNPIYRFLTGLHDYGAPTKTVTYNPPRVNGKPGVDTISLGKIGTIGLSDYTNGDKVFADIPKEAWEFSRKYIARAARVMKTDLIVIRG